MPDDSAPLPAIICHYAAILRTWAHAAPEASVHGNQAELQLSPGSKILAARVPTVADRVAHTVPDGAGTSAPRGGARRQPMAGSPNPNLA